MRTFFYLRLVVYAFMFANGPLLDFLGPSRYREMVAWSGPVLNGILIVAAYVALAVVTERMGDDKNETFSALRRDQQLPRHK